VRSRIARTPRARTCTVLALVLLIALLTAEGRAQQPANARQVGYLISGPAASWTNRIDALRMGLRDLGYVEGKT
jgi:hypothetical protein